MREMTMVGGGLGGLVAAVAGAEEGFAVRLLEAKPRLGGRARSADGPSAPNWGPHVIYSDGPMWAWLDERGLARPAARPPLTAKLLFRIDGRAKRLPAPSTIRALLRLRRLTAPVDQTFTEWATEIAGDESAHRLATLMGVATFDHDPGRLSAAFVNKRLRRVTVVPPAARYIPGGWTTLVERLADRAVSLGVRVETGARIDEVPESPVVMAVPMDVGER